MQVEIPTYAGEKTWNKNSLNAMLWKRLPLTVFLAWYFQALASVWTNLSVLVNNFKIRDFFLYAFHPNWKWLSLFLGILALMQWMCWGKEKAVLEFVYHRRLLLSMVAVAVLVLFNINGSSIHMISNYVTTDANGVLLGTARGIRSDEWATSTPLAFSQGAAGYPYFSSVPRGDQTDMYITYGQAVKDYAILFRPFYWGYIFLGASRGLSFFWWSRTFALMLVSFEFGMLIAKGQKKYAIFFSCMITFSPFVQWWFAVVGMVEMLIFGMGAVLLFRGYLRTESYSKRLLLALTIAWCGCVYILTLYPAWMVPLAYIYLCCIIWTVYENRNCKLNLKKDGVILFAALVVVAGNLAYVILKSEATIATIMNTVYPGNRRGGQPVSLDTLYNYVLNLFTTLKDDMTNTNASESSTFFSFFPLGIVLFLYQFYRERKVDLLSFLLVVVSGLFALYTFGDLPDSVDAITLLQYSTPFRMVPMLSLAQFILLFRVVANMKCAVDEWLAIVVSFGIAVLSIWRANLYTPGYYSTMVLVITVAAVFAVCFGLMRMKKSRGVARLTAALLSAIVFFSGVLVNPIQHGTAELTDNQMTNLAKPIADADPQALWLVEGLGYPFINFLIPVGIPTINSTNVYPDMERWQLIDKTGESADVYNRYAHIRVDLANSATVFEAGATPDQFTVKLNARDLKLLDIGYIYTRRNLENYGCDDVLLVLLNQVGDDRVYKVVYQ